jgi:hypothetical protein
VAATALSEMANQLSQDIAEIPERAKLAARQGFEVVHGLSDVDRQRAVDEMLTSLEKGSPAFDTEPLSNIIPTLTRRDAGRLATALSISLALLTQNSVSAGEFVQAARGTIFEPASEAAAHAIADLVISQREKLAKAMARNRLANVVLPSVSDFSVTVDIRLQFTNDKVDAFVPVAIVAMDTDGENNRLWCQLSRADVDMILEKLRNAANQMDLAEKMMAQFGLPVSEE